MRPLSKLPGIRQQSSGEIPDFSCRNSLLWARVGSTLLPTANGCPGRPANTTVYPQKPRGKKQLEAGWKGVTIPGATSPPEDLLGVSPPLQEVGTEGPNSYGLYNMSVGVHEWCSDRYCPNYYEASPNRNPGGPSGGDRRAARGGAWRHAVRYSRCSARSSIGPKKTFNDFGFRCALPL